MEGVFSSDDNSLNTNRLYIKSSKKKLDDHRIGLIKPNLFGIFEMNGLDAHI